MTVTQPPRAETREIVFPFMLERSEQDGDGDGLTFEGYAAVFNSPTAIRDQDGEYTEIVAPGAFRKSIREKTPILMFDHGKHPVIGNMPLGLITEIREDPRGLYVKARLDNNWLIQPVRDAIASRAIDGMSFRFEVIKDDWTARGRSRTRTLKEVRAPEVGPVVFPAYSDTVASVRSSVRALAEQYPDVVQIGHAVKPVTGAEIAEAVQAERDAVVSTEDPTLSDLVSDAVEQLWGLDDNTSDAYVIDMFDDHAIFTVQGNGQPDYPGLWRVNFTYTDGQVSISTPVRPAIADYQTGANSQELAGIVSITTDERVEERETPDNSQEQSTSHEAADSGTSEEAATRTFRSMPREQVIRAIQLKERGIALPKGA